MMSFSVTTNIDKSLAVLKQISGPGQLRFVTMLALTKTAVDIQKEVRGNMPQRFTRRRKWVVQGIRIKPATKERLEAEVFSIDPFMGRQEAGGMKQPKKDRNLAIPLEDVRRTKSQMIKPADLPANLGKAEFERMVGSKKNKQLRKFRGAGGEVFKMPLKDGRVILARRRKGQVEKLYILQPAAAIKPRLGLREDGMRIAKERFLVNLDAALQRVLAGR